MRWTGRRSAIALSIRIWALCVGEPIASERGVTVTVKEAAAILGVTPARVRQLIASGALGAVKVGRDWSIVEFDLWRMVSDRATGIV